MPRLRCVMPNRIPSDHLIDIENLPNEFLRRLPEAWPANRINGSIPEFLIEEGTNLWDELKLLVDRFAAGGGRLNPAPVTTSDDSRLLQVLPANIQEADIPKVVLNVPKEMLAPSKAVKTVSYVCMECDGFEGKNREDLEGHLSSAHGMDVERESLAGKDHAVKKPGVSQKHAAADEGFWCDAPACSFKAVSRRQLQGHKMGVHRQRKRQPVEV